MLMLVALLAACKKREQPTPAPAHATPIAAPTQLPAPMPTAAPPAPTNVVAPTEVAATPPPTNTPPKAIRLEPKWPVGNRYVYRMDLEQTSTNRIPFRPEPRVEHVTMGATYALSVHAQNTNGTRDLDVEFLAYELDMKADGHEVVSFDSGKAATNNTPDPVAAALRRVIGPKVYLQLNAAGTAGQVIRLGDWQRAVAGAGDQPVEQILLQQFNDGFFQQITDFGKALPAEPVRVGDNWSYRTEVPAGSLGHIVSDSTITLLDWEQRENQSFAVLESKGTLKGIPMAGAANSLSLESGSVTGSSWFDPVLGALMESEVTQAMRLRAEPPAPRGESAPGVFISEIGQKVTLKLVEVSNGGKN
jgi:hypothetical protein